MKTGEKQWTEEREPDYKRRKDIIGLPPSYVPNILSTYCTDTWKREEERIREQFKERDPGYKGTMVSKSPPPDLISIFQTENKRKGVIEKKEQTRIKSVSLAPYFMSSTKNVCFCDFSSFLLVSVQPVLSTGPLVVLCLNRQNGDLSFLLCTSCAKRQHCCCCCWYNELKWKTQHCSALLLLWVVCLLNELSSSCCLLLCARFVQSSGKLCLFTVREWDLFLLVGRGVVAPWKHFCHCSVMLGHWAVLRDLYFCLLKVLLNDCTLSLQWSAV